MPPGYSGTPLIKKLGIAPGMTMALLNAPADVDDILGQLPEGVTVKKTLRGRVDLLIFFTLKRAALVKHTPALRRAIFPDGMAWIAWPKKASKVPTDVTEDVIREVVIPAGLIDVKVCAVSDIWSGLKLVVPVRDRG